MMQLANFSVSFLNPTSNVLFSSKLKYGPCDEAGPSVCKV